MSISLKDLDHLDLIQKIKSVRVELKTMPNPSEHKYGCAAICYYRIDCNCGVAQLRVNHLKKERELEDLLDEL